jgi:Putative beta-barrel porin-2, OmpL-like. bbp2
MTHRKLFTTVLSPVAAAVALAMALPSSAFAQSNEELMAELKALKARISQLETQASQTSAPAAAAAGGVDPAEFNRIKVKTEALEDNAESMGFKGLKINGWMDPTYIYSSSRKAGSFNFLNNFDARNSNSAYSFDNSYFGMAMLDLQKEMEGGTKWRLTLAPQKGSASGYNYGSIVHEATVSVPLGDLQTKMIAGQFPDWSGYEYIPSTQNKLITHNMLFDFTMPNYYTGAGMELVRGKWTLKGLVGNMNSNRHGKSDSGQIITYRGDYANNEYSGFGFAGQHGKSAGNKVNMVEADAFYTRGDWSLFGQLSAGALANAATDASKSKWTGASGTAAYKITPKLEVIARLDMIKNAKNDGGVFGSATAVTNCPDYDATTKASSLGLNCTDGINGFGSAMEQDTAGMWQPTGKGVNRSALSLGLNYTHSSNVSFKAEVRNDRASGAVFLQQDGLTYKKSNNLLGLSTVVSF